jgi:adenylate cyclase
MNSRNGTKVNGMRIEEKRLDPGDTLSVAKHKYTIQYSPADLGAVGPPPPDIPDAVLFSKSLLERAGLEVKRKHAEDKKKTDGKKKQHDAPGRYEIMDDDSDQLRKKHQAL